MEASANWNAVQVGSLVPGSVVSTFPGRRLEDFLDDLYFNPPTDEQRAFWEPHREEVERALGDFDAETQSWRDYRNSLASNFEPIP